MTLHEFFAWFDGFCENIKQRPTAEQWAKVKEKIKMIKAPPAALPAANGIIPAKAVEPQPRPVMSKGQAMSAGP